ncbi:hypothetical protein A0044_03585 [Campylobacter upsaliensis]|uniref:Uncharacterized protein n=1 Tax=Campylobacter upsaliensis TaxID=28080 RepID=A0A5L8T9Q3_CAMUP|nr:hypothetical protein [Campylobacter upsaliensis]EAL8904136.1 hypothetical protein [Campylobacter upsaliensis]
MQNKKLKTIFYLVLIISTLSSLFGIFLSFILIQLNIFNSVEFFLNLPYFMQIATCAFYVFLWLFLFFVFYKELNA